METFLKWFCENLDGIMVGVLTTLIIQFPFLTRNIIFNRIKKPFPKIDVREISDSSLRLDFSQYNKRKSKIDYLSFKIDIPGRLIDYKIDKGLVENVIIDTDRLVGVANINLAETIRIQLINIQPEGWCYINLNFKSTYSKKTTDIVQKPLFLDLHNISKVRYNWTSLGKVKGSIFYHNFSTLKYIEEDNNRLLSSPLFNTMEEIKEMNDKRKNW